MNPLRWVLLFLKTAPGYLEMTAIDMSTGEILKRDVRTWRIAKPDRVEYDFSAADLLRAYLRGRVNF